MIKAKSFCHFTGSPVATAYKKKKNKLFKDPHTKVLYANLGMKIDDPTAQHNDSILNTPTISKTGIKTSFLTHALTSLPCGLSGLSIPRGPANRTRRPVAIRPRRQ